MIFTLSKLIIYNMSVLFFSIYTFFAFFFIILKIVYKYWLKMTLCLSKYDIWPKEKNTNYEKYHIHWKRIQSAKKKTLMKKSAQNDNTMYKDGDLMTYEK